MITKMKKTLLLIITVLLNTLCIFSQNTIATSSKANSETLQIGVKTISNNSFTNFILTVSYNETAKTFSIEDKASGKIFVKDGILEGAEKIIDQETVTSSAFGRGKILKINKSDGGYFSLELFPKQPFLFITTTIKNNKPEAENISSIVPANFKLNLGKAANELKTLGTGGLSDPDKNPGSYVFLTTVDPKSRNGVVTGWLTHEKGCGVLFSEVINDEINIKTQIDYGQLRIDSGKTETLETFVIGYFNDARLGEEYFADAIAKKLNIKIKPHNAVYCTWYSEKNGGAGSEKSSIELADFIKKNLKSYGLKTFQIDDQWQGAETYNGPRRGFDRVDPKGGYPNGMTKTAKAVKDAGLQAGIWWMPFARNHEDPEYKDKQNWFANRDNGKPYETRWGGTSLDLTNPEVLNHISNLSKTLKGWGYNYFKMDGLWTGTVTEHVYINDGYKNDTMGNCKPLLNNQKTQIQAYRDGLKTLRKAVGSDVFFSGCAISQNMRTFGASMGLVDAMRIGPDFNHDGQGLLTGVIRGARLYFLNGRIWWNDLDPALLRGDGNRVVNINIKDEKRNIENLRMLPSWVALTGAVYLSSDWLPDLPKEKIEIMKRCMSPHNAVSRPVDAFNKQISSIWLTTDIKSGVRRDIIGIFNWDTIPHNFGAKTDWTGLENDKVYFAYDFWGNKILPDISNSFNYDLQPRTCKVIAVRAKSNHPVIVSTSRHVTQGIVDIKKEEWKNGILFVTSEIIGGDDYEIRIAGLNPTTSDGENWELKELKISENSKNISIKALPQTEKGWLRIVISTKNDCIVKWQAIFKK